MRLSLFAGARVCAQHDPQHVQTRGPRPPLFTPLSPCPLCAFLWQSLFVSFDLCGLCVRRRRISLLRIWAWFLSRTHHGKEAPLRVCSERKITMAKIQSLSKGCSCPAGSRFLSFLAGSALFLASIIFVTKVGATDLNLAAPGWHKI